MVDRLRKSEKKRRSFFREFVFGGKSRIEDVLNGVLSLGQRNLILSHGSAPEICSALHAAGLSSQFCSVVDTAGNYAKLEGDGSFEIGHLKDLTEDWAEELLKRGFSKDKFIVKAILNGILFQGKIFSRVIYIDDKAETSTLPEDKVLVIKLPVESSGVSIEQHDRLKAMHLNENDLVVWDFDCTLAQVHMYKTMNMHMSLSWRKKWGPKFISWFNSVFGEEEVEEEEEKEEGTETSKEDYDEVKSINNGKGDTGS